MSKKRNHYFNLFKQLFIDKSDDYLLGYFDCLGSVISLVDLIDPDYEALEIEYHAVKSILIQRKLIK